MKTSLALLALLLLTVATSAQSHPELRPGGGQGYGTINAMTGEMTLGRTPFEQKTVNTHNVFSNTDSTGYWTVWGTTSEAVDFGEVTRVTGSRAVTQYEFSYGTSTNNSGPITLCNLIYEGYGGGCSALGLGAQATGGFCWSNLPGGSATTWSWTFTVWSTGDPLWYQDNDEFLHGMIFFDSVTGPSLNYAGSAVNCVVPDANGQNIYFDGYAPDVTHSTHCGTYFFCPVCLPNVGSWHLSIDQVDAAASTPAECNWYCGSGTNVDFLTTTVLRQREGIAWQCSMAVSSPHVGALVAGYLGQLVFPIWGQEGLVDITKPEVMGLPTGYGSTVQITWPVPPNMQYVGYHVFLQSAAFGGGIELSCAYDCTVGY